MPNALKKAFTGPGPCPCPCQARQSTRVAPRGVTATGVVPECVWVTCVVIVIVIGQTKCGDSEKESGRPGKIGPVQI